MPQITRGYDFKHWAVTLNALPISGFDKEEGFNIEWAEDWFTKTVGCDGEFTYNAMHDFSAEITLKLLQTSASNPAIEALMLAVAALASGVGDILNLTTFVFTATYLGTPGAMYIGQSCRAMKPASVSAGKEVGVREYKLHCPRLIPQDPTGGIGF